MSKDTNDNKPVNEIPLSPEQQQFFHVQQRQVEAIQDTMRGAMAMLLITHGQELSPEWQIAGGKLIRVVVQGKEPGNGR